MVPRSLAYNAPSEYSTHLVSARRRGPLFSSRELSCADPGDPCKFRFQLQPGWQPALTVFITNNVNSNFQPLDFFWWGGVACCMQGNTGGHVPRVMFLESPMLLNRSLVFQAGPFRGTVSLAGAIPTRYCALATRVAIEVQDGPGSALVRGSSDAHPQHWFPRLATNFTCPLCPKLARVKGEQNGGSRSTTQGPRRNTRVILPVGEVKSFFHVVTPPVVGWGHRLRLVAAPLHYDFYERTP